MLRQRAWAKLCLALAAVLGGSGLVAALALAFPNPAPQWLSIKGTGDDFLAQAYYAAIGAPATFSAWKAAYGFNGSNDIQARYYNAGDLGFGREMHCRQNGSDTACYVVNHGLGAGAPAELSVAAAVAGQQTLAAVAMVYHGAQAGQPNKVQFFIYNVQTDQRLNGVQLDGQGVKFAPVMCLACHGSSDPVTNTQILNAHFLPFDLASFRYSRQAGFTQADQEEALRQLNALVRATDPPAVEAQLIDGWYSLGGVNTPGATFQDSFVPPSYTGTLTDTALYEAVIKRNCRSCHITQSPDLSAPGQVNSARDAVFASYLMPHAELTNHNFWSSSAPISLANNRGWSLRVTRTDDPAPDGCLPGDCSLREAVIDSDNSPGPAPAIITFDVVGTFTLNRAGNDDAALVGDLDLTQSVTLLGNGPARTIIDANGIDRAFQILNGAHAVIQGVTIQGGLAFGDGGGIDNVGSFLELVDSVVRDNATALNGENGAGIASRAGATTHIEQSTIGPNNGVSGNPGAGGGLYNEDSTLTLDSSTVTSNGAPDGAALYNVGAGAVMTLTQATVTANNGGTAGVVDDEAGATLAMASSLVTGNASGACLLQPGSIYHSLGYNLVGDDGSANGCGMGANDQVVASGSQSVLEIVPVGDSAGHIFHPLVPGSPAIGAIPVNAGCALPSYDQRNSPRPAPGLVGSSPACDIGARQFVRALVTTNQDVSGDDGLCSLREAVVAAGASTASGLRGGECPAGPDEIILGGPGPYDLTSGELAVRGELILLGHGQTIRRMAGTTRLFHVTAGATLNLVDATLRDGSLPTFSVCALPCANFSGGALLIDVNGTANLLDSALVGNHSNAWGGAIFNQGSLNLANSTLSGNTANFDGGGLDNLGTALLTHVTLSGNTAGSAPPVAVGRGGGLATFGGTVSIKNSLIAGNGVNTTGPSYPDVYFDPAANQLVSNNYNLVGDGTGAAGHFNQPHDQVGSQLAPIDAQLGALTGTPLYYPLLDASPAIDKIPPAACQFLTGVGNPLFAASQPVGTDQRGAPRPANFTRQPVAQCDIGAIERVAAVFLPLVRRSP